jgi:hypothetical protein
VTPEKVHEKKPFLGGSYRYTYATPPRLMLSLKFCIGETISWKGRSHHLAAGSF